MAPQVTRIWTLSLAWAKQGNSYQSPGEEIIWPWIHTTTMENYPCMQRVAFDVPIYYHCQIRSVGSWRANTG